MSMRFQIFAVLGSVASLVLTQVSMGDMDGCSRVVVLLNVGVEDWVYCIACFS